MIGAHHQIRAGLGCGIGAVGRQGRGLSEHAGLAQSAVNLIGGNLQILHAGDKLPGILVVRLHLPGALSGIQQHLRADDIGGQEHFGLGDAAVHMGLSGKVHHGVKPVLAEQLGDQPAVTDIALDKRISGIILHRLQIGQIACVGQRVQRNHLHLGIGLQHILHEIGTNETGGAGYQHHLHTISSSATRSIYSPYAVFSIGCASAMSCSLVM